MNMDKLDRANELLARIKIEEEKKETLLLLIGKGLNLGITDYTHGSIILQNAVSEQEFGMIINLIHGSLSSKIEKLKKELEDL